MADPDFHFDDGFDDYGPAGFRAVVGGVSNDSSYLVEAWTQLWATDLGNTNDLDLTIVDGLISEDLASPGLALQLSYDNSAGTAGLSRTIPGAFKSLTGSAAFMIPEFGVNHLQGICFGDTGSDQFAITIEPSGQFGVRRASGSSSALLGTLLATSAESVVAGVPFNLQWKIVVGNADGAVQLWLNGVPTSLSFTGDTQNTANASCNQVRLMLNGIGITFPASNKLVVDHLSVDSYLVDGGEVPPLTNVVVETQFPISDDAVDFAVGAAIFGDDASNFSTSNAPGANQLFLRKYTPDVDGTLDSVSLLPGASSLTAKFRACAYADSAGAPGALLSDGMGVTGCTVGEYLTDDLASSQALVAGTPVWIGFCGDTAVALYESPVDTSLGRKVARTYGSGAPNPAGAMTPGQPCWVIFGNVSGVTEHWSVIDNNPYSGDRSYLWSATPGDQDTFAFPLLSVTPTAIYNVAVKIVARRAGAGARTMDLLTVSAAATGSGDAPGQTPPAAYGPLVSNFLVDPDTGAAWNLSGVNLALHGFKIAS